MKLMFIWTDNAKKADILEGFPVDLVSVVQCREVPAGKPLAEMIVLHHVDTTDKNNAK